jgi:Flp pilus assembly protein TadD
VASLSLAPPIQAPADPATAEHADNVRPLCDEALAHHGAGQFGAAIPIYIRILSLRPDWPEVYNNLGHALAAAGKAEAALLAFQSAVELKPNNPEALCNWGLAFVELGRLDDAEAKYRQAIGIAPGFAGAYNNLGLLLKEKGRLSEASLAFEQAIDLAPARAAYYDNMAAVRQLVAGDRYVTALEEMAKDPAAVPADERVHLHFALAKAYDGMAKAEGAFQELLQANRLKRAQISYDEAATLSIMGRQRELIGRDFVAARHGCGERSALPVFIVGMTRSGTTLIEQILASHPQVFGAGELSLFDQAAGAIRNRLPGSPAFPDMMAAMSADHFCDLGRLYVDGIVRRAPQAARITDKMTSNFLLCGLIHLALPNATIIHAVRDPVDTCMSSFAAHFTKGNEHTYDLAELGRYYRHYRALMAHWHEVLPRGRILDVHYEELVGDLEGVARRLLSHCGLAWDACCLEFHRNGRPVRTASASQVRQPIYRDSVGRWRKYEAFIAPLLAELDPAVRHGAPAQMTTSGVLAASGLSPHEACRSLV